MKRFYRPLVLLLFIAPSLMAQDATTMRFDHAISNLETEVAYLKQKIENQESRLDTMHKEVKNLLQATKEASQKSITSQEGKIEKTEKALEKLLADVKAIKAHANEMSDSLAEFQKNSTLQKEGIDHQLKELEASIKNLAKAMQTNIQALVKEEPQKKSTELSYRVKNGDSLAKIAKNFNISMNSLKEYNSLESNKIVIGQELKIPQ